MGKKLDLTGQKFGRLTGIREIERDFSKKFPRYNGVMWLFRCDCGKEKAALGSFVKNGRLISCGCAQHDSARKAFMRRASQCDKDRLLDRLDRSIDYDDVF